MPAKTISNNESDTGGLTFLGRHGYEITNNSEYYKLDINEAQGTNSNGIGTAKVKRRINILPVPEKNLLVSILEYNEDDIIQDPITPPIAPTLIIIKNDNNN